MKSRGIKISLFILIVIQLALGVKLSVQFIGTVWILPLDIAIASAFIFCSLLISSLFVINLLSTSSRQVNIDKELLEKNEVKIKNEQKLIKEEEKRRLQILDEKKKLIVGELIKDLNIHEGLQKYSEKALINISKQFNIMQGLFFMKDQQDKVYRKVGTYAYYNEEDLREFTEEVGLSGQVAANKKLLNISNIPDKYITVLSGLGHSSPANLVIFPILCNNESIGVIELASFVKFDLFAEEVFMEYSAIIGKQLFEIMKEKEKIENQDKN